MKELSVFVDESGDFGEYDYHAPYYIISMVFHNQDIDISEDVQDLERDLKNLGWTNHCVHAGPVIRSEEEYRGYELKDRQKILMKMMNFIRHLDVQFKSIYIDKKHIGDSIEATGKLSKQLAVIIRDNYAFFVHLILSKFIMIMGRLKLPEYYLLYLMHCLKMWNFAECYQRIIGCFKLRI